jgi:cysteine-S-conjugate beta-lyase
VLGLTAAIAAYRDGSDWLEQMMMILEGNRDFVVDFVQKRLPQIEIHKPEATYLAWLDCRKLGLNEEPQKFFLETARVALNCGEDFGISGRGFVRLNFGCTREVLTEAMERMERAIQQK